MSLSDAIAEDPRLFAGQYLSGLNEGLADAAGTPVDAARWLLNLPGRGIDLAADAAGFAPPIGADLVPEGAFGGSGWFRRGMAAAGTIAPPAPGLEEARRAGAYTGAGLGALLGGGAAVRGAAGPLARRLFDMPVRSGPDLARIAAAEAGAGAGAVVGEIEGDRLGERAGAVLDLPETGRTFGTLAGNMLGGAVPAAALGAAVRPRTSPPPPADRPRQRKTPAMHAFAAKAARDNLRRDGPRRPLQSVPVERFEAAFAARPAPAGFEDLAAAFDDPAALSPAIADALVRMRGHFAWNTRKARKDHGEPPPLDPAVPETVLNGVAALARQVRLRRSDFAARPLAASNAERLQQARDAALHVLATGRDVPYAVQIPDVGWVEFRAGNPGKTAHRYDSGGHGLTHGVVKRFAEGRNGIAELMGAMDTLVFGRLQGNPRTDRKVQKSMAGRRVVLERVPGEGRRFLLTILPAYD